MGRAMGFDFGLEKSDLEFKRKYRWLLKIPDICADKGVNALPPIKSSRPNLSFKEAEVQHLSEIVYFPIKVEWKPIQLTLYDFKKNKNPIFEWARLVYDPQAGKFLAGGDNGFMKDATLELYDGCGCTLETWVYESVWPQTIEFGDLDMSSNEVVVMDLTLRYARAYVKY